MTKQQLDDIKARVDAGQPNPLRQYQTIWRWSDGY